MEALHHFAGVTSGMHVKVHTDHLNNTVLNQNLKSPDRILRMLLKIDQMCFPQFIYLPGKVNVVGDGFSRNPKDRDENRNDVETKEGLPKTLEEAFLLVQKRRQSSDDADWIVEFAASERGSTASQVQESSTDEWIRNHYFQGFPNEISIRAGALPADTKACLFVPGLVKEGEELGAMNGTVFKGSDCSLKVEASATPPNCLSTGHAPLA